MLQVLIQHFHLALAYNVKVGEQCLHEDTCLPHMIDACLGEEYRNCMNTYSLSSVQELFKVIQGLFHLLFEQLMVGLDLMNHVLTAPH